MSLSKLSNRYAKSLLDLAIERNQVQDVMNDISAFLQATKQADFLNMLKSPIIHGSKKKSILNEIFSKGFTTLSMKFLDLTVVKGREMYLPNIANAFMQQYLEFKKITKVKVTSAIPLDAQTEQKIKDKLKNSGSVNGEILLETVIDKSIIGGLIIEVGDKIYDNSLKRNLELLKKDLVSNN